MSQGDRPAHNQAMVWAVVLYWLFGLDDRLQEI
jgi:hypothetical protein